MELAMSRRQKVWHSTQIVCVVILVGGTVFMILDLLEMVGFLRRTCPISLTRLTLVRTISADHRSRGLQIHEETLRFFSRPVNWHSPDKPLWTILTEGKSVKADAGFEKMKTLFEELWERSEGAQNSSHKFSSTENRKFSTKRPDELVIVQT